MKILYHICLVSLTISGAASAQVKPTGTNATTCTILAGQFDKFEKEMASSDIDGLLDNSAPRATLRAMEINNSLIQAQIAIDLLKAKACPLPSHVPTSSTYFSSALSCKNDQMKGVKDSESCKRENWTATGK